LHWVIYLEWCMNIVCGLGGIRGKMIVCYDCGIEAVSVFVDHKYFCKNCYEKRVNNRENFEE